MRALLQRVSRASVSVNGTVCGKIDRGLLIFLGVGRKDTAQDLDYTVLKCANLRIFEDNEGRMNHSLLDMGGQALVVSQFTLYGDTRKGRRPGFSDAAEPEEAKKTYNAFVQALRELNISVQTGIFGEHMHVEIHNDGPVTFMVESPGQPPL